MFGHSLDPLGYSFSSFTKTRIPVESKMTQEGLHIDPLSFEDHCTLLDLLTLQEKR
jgi:hypothetical protein